MSEKTYYKAVDEEFDQEQIQTILVRARKRAKDVGWATIVHKTLSSRKGGGFKSSNLLMILTHKHKTGHEGTEYLCEDVVRNFLPRKPLPDSETNGYGLQGLVNI